MLFEAAGRIGKGGGKLSLPQRLSQQKCETSAKQALLSAHGAACTIKPLMVLPNNTGDRRFQRNLLEQVFSKRQPLQTVTSSNREMAAACSVSTRLYSP